MAAPGNAGLCSSHSRPGLEPCRRQPSAAAATADAAAPAGAARKDSTPAGHRQHPALSDCGTPAGQRCSGSALAAGLGAAAASAVVCWPGGGTGRAVCCGLPVLRCASWSLPGRWAFCATPCGSCAASPVRWLNILGPTLCRPAGGPSCSHAAPEADPLGSHSGQPPLAAAARLLQASWHGMDHFCCSSLPLCRQPAVLL